MVILGKRTINMQGLSRCNSKLNRRNSPIELLRIFAGMAVVVLHFNYNPAGGGVLAFAKGQTWYVLMLLEILSVCAVNVFILISGYFNCEAEKINISRLLELLIQTGVFSLCFKILLSVWYGTFSYKVLFSIIPVNYYVILYCSLMCLAPFVNRMMKTLNAKQLKYFVLISFGICSIYPTAIDVIEDIVGKDLVGLSSISISGSIGGYTIINFIFVYIIGAYIKRADFIKKLTNTKLLLSLLVSVLLIWIWRSCLPQTAFMYCNPIVIVEAVAIFLLFLKINIKSSLINKFAPASFTCFLVHLNILRFIGINRFDGKSLTVVVCGLIFVVLGIYSVSYIVMKLWIFIAKPIFNRTIYKVPNIDIEDLK